MKIKVALYIALLMCSCSAAKAQKKIIEIKTSFDLDVRYLPSRMESVSFDVKYINEPEKTSQSNYSITYKSKSGTKFEKDTIIYLKSPLDVEVIRREFNQKLQIAGDNGARAISNNTIYELAYILDTIPHPIVERTIAGNFILNSYIKVFSKNEQQKEHKIRQDSIQRLTQAVILNSLEVDNLQSTKPLLETDSASIRLKLDSLNNKLKDINLYRRRLDSAQALQLREITTNKKISESFTESVKKQDKLINDERSRKDSLQKFYDTLSSVIKKLQAFSDTEIIDSVKIDIIKKYNEEIISRQNKLTQLKISIDINKFVNDSVMKIPKDESIKTLKEAILIVQSNIKEVIERISSLSINMAKIQAQSSIISQKENKLRDSLNTIEFQQIKSIDINALEAERQEIQIKNLELKNKIQEIDQKIKKLKAAIKNETDTLDARSIFLISKLSLQIERGFIERIQVYIPTKNGDQNNIYENIFAIGFSSIKNFKKFTQTMLYSRLTDDYIYLSDVITNFDNLLENYTRDYSPADTTVNNFKPSQGFIRLNRDQFMNLFDTRVYTDLMGISDSKPNGLVQIEVARKFNIQTSRRQIKGFRSDWGAVTYFNIFGSLNKLENNKKYLPLRNENVGSNGQLLSPFYATNLDFRLYQNLTLGAELNLFLFDWPDGKLTAYFDVGLGYGQTPLTYNRRTVIGNAVSQSIRDSSLLAHSSTAYPKITLEIFSEKRVRLYMSYQFNTTRIYSNNNFKAIASYAKSDLIDRATEPYARQSHMIEFNLMASPSSTQRGRFFFRARYFLQSRDHNTFFSQIQFGYTYNLRLKKFDA